MRYTADGDDGGVYVYVLKSGEIALADGELIGKGYIVYRDFQKKGMKNFYFAQIEYKFPSCFVVMYLNYPSATQEDFMKLLTDIMGSFRFMELKKFEMTPYAKKTRE